MKLVHLRTNRLKNPLGFPVSSVSLSFQVEESTGSRLKAARICISDKEDMSHIIYDTGMREELSSLGFVPEYSFEGGKRYYWTVSAVADDGDCQTSETAWFEGGRKTNIWDVKWISSPFHQETHPVMAKEFSLEKTGDSGTIEAARLYISGLGVYEAYLNGEKIGQEYLAPFFDDYRYWVQYETYDITEQLRKGKNTLAVMLGNGWYKGRFGYLGEGKEKGIYGDAFLLSAELWIRYADGKEETIHTDESWLCGKSPVLSSGIYDGEVFDRRIQVFSDDGEMKEEWKEEALPAIYAKEDMLPKGNVEERLSLPLCIHERIGSPKLIITPKQEQVLDFGQEISGWVEFDCPEDIGESIHLQYGEILQDDCFYRENLRTAKAEFTYICPNMSNGKSKKRHVRPHFTFYGFRFVKVSGITLTKEQMKDWNFEACALYSDLERTGNLTTSNEKLNRLIENTIWGQKGNFLDVPTDCPQRDERLGWTGDAQVFCATASYHMDTAGFYRKYLKDMLFEQREHGGGVPYVVPDILSIVRRRHGEPEPDITKDQWGEYGSCAWGDAATVIPWTMYLFYGDKYQLEESYPNMKAWTDFIIHMEETVCGGDRLWNRGFHFADWLALDNPDPESCFGQTDPYYVASVYYMYSAELTAKAARVLGYKDDEVYYKKIAKEVKEAIRNEYITSDGHIKTETQTSLVLALYFDLLKEEWKEEAAQRLKKKLEEKHMHLDTGFVGTAYLCKALTKAGMTKEAYSLLLQEEYPSWLYEVNMGATTVWERWNSVLPNGKISGTGMNSLNHYAYGAVAEWMYQTMCGIQPDETAPGFKKAILAPKPDQRLSFVKGSYHSACGIYRLNWEQKGEEIQFEVEIPFDCEAVFLVPEGMRINVINGVEMEEKESILLGKGIYRMIGRW